MSEPVAVEQCGCRDVFGRRCALIAGHGVASSSLIRGDVIDGHLYPAGEDLSGEIRHQAALDRLAAAEQRAEAAEAVRDEAVKLAAALDVAASGRTAALARRAEAAEAERDRMRPVVEAAVAWSKWDPKNGLYDSVCAYRAGHPATSEAERIAATLVCSTCNDTHRMTLGDREVPCTRCPVPCETCRSRPVGAGPGAYCAGTPCGCPCHRAGAWRKP